MALLSQVSASPLQLQAECIGLLSTAPLYTKLCYIYCSVITIERTQLKIKTPRMKHIDKQM
jgi:hypothetical protein